MSIVLSTSQLAAISVYKEHLIPAEGPVCIPLFLDFTAATEYIIDGQKLQDFASGGGISMIQTVFIDSTGCTTNVIVINDASGQQISVKPNTQGYYPILVPNPFKLRVDCATGPAGVKVFLLNFPVSPGQWATV